MNITLTNSTAYYQTGLNFYLFPAIIIPIHSVNVLLGLPLNIYIIYLLFPGRVVMDASDVLSFNQAIAEMLFGLLAPFHSLCSLNLKLCLIKAVSFLLGASMISRSFFPCCVCFERYLAVVHPVIYLKYKSSCYRLAIYTMTWLFILAVGIACTVTFPYLPYNIYATIYALVFTVDVFCGASILKRLRHPGPQDNDTGEMNAVKKKAFQIVCINLLIFLIQSIPFCVMFVVQATGPQYTFRMVQLSCLAICTVSGFWQPIFVLHKTGKLSFTQSAYISIPFSSCCIRSRAQPTQHTENL